MKKNLLTFTLLTVSIPACAQFLTNVGKDALLTVTDGALVYNGGGLQVAASIDPGTGVDKGRVHNMGDIMLVGSGSDQLRVGADAEFILQTNAARNTIGSNTEIDTYGQLYITGISQGNILGIAKKEYIADYDNSNTGGSQQIGLPFFEYTTANLVADLGNNFNLTNNALTGTSGRYAHNSVFRWNNQRAQFDQVIGGSVKMGAPTDYYIIPTVQSDGSSVSWDPVNLNSFKGRPVAETTPGSGAPGKYNVKLFASWRTTYGTKGQNVNDYNGRYNTYLSDPFESINPDGTWPTYYFQNLCQFSNPFLTNLDLNDLSATGLQGVKGIAYFGENSINWKAANGTTYNGTSTIVLANYAAGVPQTGDVDKMVIKPLGALIIKFDPTNVKDADLAPLRSFKQTKRTAPANGVTAAKMTTAKLSIPSDQLYKQVAVVAYDSANNELGRTYYAVSPSAVTANQSTAKMQGYYEGSAIYTKEEMPTGGEDTSLNTQLYINVANEVDYKNKEIPLYVNNVATKKFKFEVYEGGRRVKNLSNGNSFYIMKDNEVTKITDGDDMPVASTRFGLFYDRPQAAVGNGPLGNINATKAQTIIAKKDSDWVVRFADTWKSAEVEVYSAAGQLIHIDNNVSTANDYIVPLSARANGLYLIKAKSDAGEIVVKKVIK